MKPFDVVTVGSMFCISASIPSHVYRTDSKYGNVLGGDGRLGAALPTGRPVRSEGPV